MTRRHFQHSRPWPLGPIAFVVLVIVALVVSCHQYRECSKRNGALVRGAFTMECVPRR